MRNNTFGFAFITFRNVEDSESALRVANLKKIPIWLCCEWRSGIFGAGETEADAIADCKKAISVRARFLEALNLLDRNFLCHAQDNFLKSAEAVADQAIIAQIQKGELEKVFENSTEVQIKVRLQSLLHQQAKELLRHQNLLNQDRLQKEPMRILNIR